MNLVSYKMKKFWFVTSADIGLYMVHIHNHWGGGEVIEFQLKQPVMERKITFLRGKVKFIISLLLSINTFNGLNVSF